MNLADRFSKVATLREMMLVYGIAFDVLKGRSDPKKAEEVINRVMRDAVNRRRS